MKHISISQIKLFRMDPIVWAIQYLLKIKPTPTEPLIFGVTFAEAIERAITGEPLEYTFEFPGKIKVCRMLAQRWLDERGFILDEGNWIVEHGFEVKLAEDLPKFVGRLDLYNPEMNEILDFKTVSHNLDNNKFWGLSKKDLENDLQLNLYAWYNINMRQGNKDKMEVRLGHEQIVKQKRRGQIVDFDIRHVAGMTTGDKVRKIVDGIKETAYEMIKVKELFDEKGIEGVINKYYHMKQKFIFGSPCPFWNYTVGAESLDNLLRRFKA